MAIEKPAPDRGIPDEKQVRLLGALSAFRLVVEECLKEFPENEALQFASGYATTVREKLFPRSASPARPPTLERSK